MQRFFWNYFNFLWKWHKSRRQTGMSDRFYYFFLRMTKKSKNIVDIWPSLAYYIGGWIPPYLLKITKITQRFVVVFIQVYQNETFCEKEKPEKTNEKREILSKFLREKPQILLICRVREKVASMQPWQNRPKSVNPSGRWPGNENGGNADA